MVSDIVLQNQVDMEASMHHMLLFLVFARNKLLLLCFRLYSFFVWTQTVPKTAPNLVHTIFKRNSVPVWTRP